MLCFCQSRKWNDQNHLYDQIPEICFGRMLELLGNSYAMFNVIAVNSSIFYVVSTLWRSSLKAGQIFQTQHNAWCSLCRIGDRTRGIWHSSYHADHVMMSLCVYQVMIYTRRSHHIAGVTQCYHRWVCGIREMLYVPCDRWCRIYHKRLVSNVMYCMFSSELRGKYATGLPWKCISSNM